MCFKPSRLGFGLRAGCLAGFALVQQSQLVMSPTAHADCNDMHYVNAQASTWQRERGAKGRRGEKG